MSYTKLSPCLRLGHACLVRPTEGWLRKTGPQNEVGLVHPHYSDVEAVSLQAAGWLPYMRLFYVADLVSFSFKNGTPLSFHSPFLQETWFTSQKPSFRKQISGTFIN